MCVISMVYEYMQKNVEPGRITPEIYEQFKKVKKEVEELDKMLGEPDCVDPAKQAYESLIEEQLKQFGQAAISTVNTSELMDNLDRLDIYDAIKLDEKEHIWQENQDMGQTGMPL